ncbi:MAG TPA: hypothetical protein VGL35_09150 [Rhizomicrobium sp.]|jgi:hypothetical protein
MRRVLGVVAVCALFAGAGVAAAGNFASDQGADFYAPGQHQFYVWCPSSSNYMTTESGSNAEDAQLRLYRATKAAGRAECWPLWQGRVRT